MPDKKKGGGGGPGTTGGFVPPKTKFSDLTKKQRQAQRGSREFDPTFQPKFEPKFTPGRTGGGNSGNGSGTTTTTTTRTRRSRTRGRGGGNTPTGAETVAQEARRQFRLAIQPYLDQIKRAQQQARQETNQTINRTQNVYSALGSQLGAINGQDQYAAIGNNLATQTAALAPLMNQSIGQAPASEATAAQGLLGAIGTGGVNQIGQIGATALANNQSAQRQGIEESAITQRNALGDLANFRQDLSQQKVDLFKQAPAQIKQLISDIEQRNLNNKLAFGQLAVSRGGLDLQRMQMLNDQATTSADNALMSEYYKWLMSGG